MDWLCFYNSRHKWGWLPGDRWRSGVFNPLCLPFLLALFFLHVLIRNVGFLGNPLKAITQRYDGHWYYIGYDNHNNITSPSSFSCRPSAHPPWETSAEVSFFLSFFSSPSPPPLPLHFSKIDFSIMRRVEGNVSHLRAWPHLGAEFFLGKLTHLTPSLTIIGLDEGLSS